MRNTIYIIDILWHISFFLFLILYLLCLICDFFNYLEKKKGRKAYWRMPDEHDKKYLDN